MNSDKTLPERVVFKETYRKLIDQLCKELSIEVSEAMYESCDLQVNGVNFTLFQGEAKNADGEAPNAAGGLSGAYWNGLLYVCCDLGDIPAEIAPQIMQHLLEANLYLLGNNAPRFGFNSITRRPVLMNPVTVSQTSPDLLKALIINLAAYARQWRHENIGDKTSS